MPSHPVATGLSPLRSLSGPIILSIALFALLTATPSRRVSGQPGTTSTIWLATEVPSVPADPEVGSAELGLKFRSDVDGVVAAVRFYKAPTNTGTHVANLWTGTGTKLATATFTNETASGWQQVTFPTPIAVKAGTVYVASYHMNVGHYSDDEYYFTGHGLDRPPLHALADGESGPNGAYAVGAASAFPTLGWHASNYWVDVVFIAGTISSDTTPPTVTAFTIPATASALAVSILGFAATDNVGVTGYLATESASAPSAGAAGWTSSPPATYTFPAAGVRTLYGWAKDAAGNVSTSLAASVTITLADTAAPTITAFTMPSTSSTLTVPITRFTATDNVAVTAYLVKESSATPSPTASEWTATAPAAYTFATAGSKTLYAWVEDAARNVSARKSASVRITLPASGVEPTGWYAGDMHVHRSCGGTPEAISSIYQKMSTQNIAVISLLADMGNGEGKGAAQDLPRVNAQNDDPVSTPGRTVHWDAEWHWDATYFQYPHQALGGHINALGLSEAHQIWEEYTYPIFQWAHDQNGIAGFVHMEYLDDGIPQTLTCCTPIEYPVEVALGAADFIAEDVAPADSAIHAYYRLLNTGFRPGFAAGTDYPCNGGAAPGALLTYVRVAPQTWSYRHWIDGIAAGRTVVSANGHHEFLNLTVNGTAQPGDEIDLTAAGPVPVTVQWTANTSVTGTIEIVQNGVVVASRQASVASGSPATLTATVNFSQSGWLAARRMGDGGHKVHTGAVFVIVGGRPIRVSASDAQFYVQWMDNLLTKTSQGGAWHSYFPTSLGAAQARYQAAKTVFQQIAAEASAPPPVSGTTIFTTQVPNLWEWDSSGELGTEFWSDVSGQITQVRVYTHAAEGGTHVVRIWRVLDRTLVAGPYSWTITAGVEGWKTFMLPTPLAIAANTDYIVAVSNSSDRYYAEQINGFASPIVNGHLHTYVGSGVYTGSLGTMPTLVWQNTNYFRDVVFVPGS